MESENNNNNQITKRQAQILASIVKLYSEDSRPVSSKSLVDSGYFSVSGATLRNEMQALEEAGLITHPHTSSGRIPTDEGFRYFVNQLMDHVKLSIQERNELKRELLKLQEVNAEVGRRLAKVLASHSEQATFTILPEEVSSTGMSNILENDTLPAEDVREIAKFFDNLDDYAEQIMAEYSDQKPQTFIGKELTLSKGSDYSMIVTGMKLPSGQRGVVGLIGPKSMKYRKNISLLEYITKIIGGGGGAVILLITIL